MSVGWIPADKPDIDAPLPTPGTGAASTEPSDDQIAMISDMGFTAAQARKALRQSVSKTLAQESADNQDGNPERAIEWLFSNPDDAGEEAVASTAPAQTSTPTVGGSKNLPAQYRLKAFISHKGPSVHSGHYVATIRQPQAGITGSEEGEEEWVLFNDEKVVKAPARGGEEMRSLAYLYVYERL